MAATILYETTKATAFCPSSGGEDKPLLSVIAGVDYFPALSQAGCLDAAVKSLLDDVVLTGMNADVAWLCRFAMDAADALRTSVGATA